MVNRTPLRLVAIEETPPAEDELRFPAEEEDESAAPVAVMSEQDMITRKVPEAEMIASQDTFRDKPKHTPRTKMIILVAGAAVVVGGIVALVMRGKGGATPAQVAGAAAPAPAPVELPPPQPAAIPVAPAAVPPPRAKANPDTIFLGITAEPMEAELSVDGNVMAGHRLNLEVPRDPGIHVVSAAAPGYIPFNQQVSFSSDVFLKISLRRAHTPSGHQVTKTRPTPVAPSPTKNNAKPAAAVSPSPAPGPGLAPGMNLDGPAIRHNAKPIDERNPYKP